MRQVALRILRLLARRRDRVEADVGEEHDRGALMDAAEPVRRERRVVRRVDVHGPDNHEQRQHQQLDHHHDVVGARAFLHALQQQRGDRGDDGERRDVEQDGDAGDIRRGLQQRHQRRIAAGLHGPVAVRQPARHRDAEPREQRHEIAAPADRHRDVADRVLEDERPADDPGDDLAERRVRVGVGAAGLRDHRGQLGVAERRQPAHRAEQHERHDQRGAGAVPHHRAVGQHLAGGGGPERREDARADDRPDGQHDQVAGPERPLHAVSGIVGRRRSAFGRTAPWDSV